MRIQHNIMAMNAYRNYNNNTSALSKNLEKLSSGYKINRAGDDAAGLAISEKMRAQITGLNAAQKNVKDGISLVKTGEGAMQEIQDMLNRMDYLATQSANGTYDNEVDRLNLQKEVDALKSEINRIADSANFNGIKLLDGSLDTNTNTGSVDIGGNVTHKASGGAKGIYEASAAIADTTAGQIDVNSKLSFSVSLDDGTSKTVTLGIKETRDSTGTLTKYELTGSDGSTYSVAVTTGVVTGAEFATAVVSELNKGSLGEMYTISQNAGTLKLEAKEEGSATPRVTAFDYSIATDGVNFGGTTGSTPATPVSTALGVKTTAGRDPGREIDADSITEYDGTNYDDAVFTINGHKFVLLTNTLDTDDTGTANDEYLRATQGLGPDVTVLVGGRGGLKNATGAGGATSSGDSATDAANNNYAQNIKKIAEVTGLNVTDAVTEATGDNGIDAGAGIRLTAAAGKGGLVLQIGDTADEYNQLRVSIGDMHTSAMGIANVDISNQTGAQAAIQTIKNAINYVSGVRGDLGAVQNRLEHTANNLSVMAENIQDAESTIRDTDVAEEMMSYVKNNILVQSAQAMLAQANQVPQGVLQLLG